MSQTIAPVLGEATMQEARDGARRRVRAADDGYEEACRIWNGMHDARRPVLIVRCRATADVIAVVGFARANDLTVAVRGGGHSVAGFSTCDGGRVIDVSQLNGVRVDPQARRAVKRPSH
jgi:FAD/FMN-containing dehydrogenase